MNTVLAWSGLGVAVLALPMPGSRRRFAVLARMSRLSGPGAPAGGFGGLLRRAAAAGGRAAVVGAGVGFAAFAGLAAIRFGVAIGSAAAAAGCVVVTGLRDALDGRRAVADRADLSAAVRVVAAELDAGSTPSGALAAAAESSTLHADTFAHAAQCAGTGADAAAVLLDYPGTRALGAAWAVSASTGAPLSGVVGRVAAEVDAEVAQRRAVAVALSGPTSSAVVLTALPAVGVAMGAGMGARPLHVLLDLPAGHLLCAAGVLLDAAGVWWMRRILAAARRV